MVLELDQILEKYPRLSRKWVMERANEGLLRHSRPHKRLFLFDDAEFEKDLFSMNRVDASDIDSQVAKEYLLKKHSRK